MDIGWGSAPARPFVTNVGLITSKGTYGDNIMAAEWTHLVSYKPGLIAVCIGPSKATAANIEETKVFGVSLAAFDQNVISSIAGGTTGKTTNKIKVLTDLGIKLYKANKIDTLMVEGASLNVECKVVHTIPLGDHTMFVGEAVDIKVGEKDSLSYHGGKYFKIGEHIEKPAPEMLDKIKQTIEKYRKNTQ